MDWSYIPRYLVNPLILEGLFTTIWLSIVSMAIGLIVGFAAALMRLSKYRPVHSVSWFYVWFFQGTPLMLQLIVIYTGLPQLGLRFDVITCVLVGLGLNEGAYLAETFRGGIQSVARGQTEASRALGMTYFTMMRRIILPQAARVIIPDTGNRFNGLMKATSLASVISMEELLRRTQMISEMNFRILELFTVAMIYYLVLTTAWGLVQSRLEVHFGKGQ
ncbi:MAG TPA: amino acid ABC transporter permease [Devosia sp.]|nr:amino acid ABC transporter permease [Devosia sp.]